MKKKTLTGGNAKISIGGQVVGTIKNISWDLGHKLEACDCGFKGKVGAIGHKHTCPLWVFADIVYEPMFPEYIMGRMAPEECLDCRAYEDGHGQVCIQHGLPKGPKRYGGILR